MRVCQQRVVRLGRLRVEYVQSGSCDASVRLAKEGFKRSRVRSPFGRDRFTIVGTKADVPGLKSFGDGFADATEADDYDDVPMFFKFRGPDRLIDGPELLEQFFIRDIVEGIADTGVRAGILKCATDQPGVTPGVERVLRAVSRAHLATGAPITTHTHASTRRGLEQQAIFRQEGVDLTRVVIGHSGDTTDIDYLRRLMDAGSYIGMDRFGMDILLPFDDRVETVVRLCELGYAERMVLSHDASCFTHNVDEADKLRLMPRWNYTHIHDAVLPALRERGVTDRDIETMLVHNPASVLGLSTQ